MKDDLVIRSETGDPEDTTIWASNSSINVLYIRANNVTVNGFKIRAAEYQDVTGIHLASCNNCVISKNNLSENYFGLYLSNSQNNIISNNSANSNEKHGIQLVRSENNLLLNNTANSNIHGIVLESNSSNNNLTGNLANSNDYGFYLINSSDNVLSNNTATRNVMGIHLINSNISLISGNNITKNINYGLWISRSNYSIVSGNTVNETSCGIHLDSADSNMFYENVIALNAESGLSMCPACDNNTVFDNYFSNFYNVDVDNRKNKWNIKKAEGKNIIGGPYIAGNFWANPAGTGFSEIASDEDKDGIADAEYNETNVTDYLPLVSVSDLQHQVPPAGNFENNISIDDITH